MSYTIKDIAREAGVSFSTVSKVINNSHEISEATASRVREVMKRMDFTPNIRASNFKRRSTKNIAFLTALKKGEAFANPHLFEVLCGAQKVLSQKGYGMSLLDISGEEKPGDTVKSVISTGGYDGIIVHGSALNQDAALMLTHSEFPYIVIGKPAFETQVSWLDTNSILAGGIAARHLVKGGSQRIAFIAGEQEGRISKDRIEGARQAIEELGFALERTNICYTDSSIDQSYFTTLQLLNSEQRPDGIICENNAIAIGTLKAIRECGIHIPDELQIITFDDYPYSQIMDPSPTVVNIDVFDLGEQAASQLMKSIKNPALHVQSYITLPQLIIRSTTRG